MKAEQISDFQVGKHKVIRRGDKAFVVDPSGEYADLEVENDVITQQWRDNIAKLTDKVLPGAIATTEQYPYLSDEGRRERLDLLRDELQRRQKVAPVATKPEALKAISPAPAVDEAARHHDTPVRTVDDAIIAALSGSGISVTPALVNELKVTIEVAARQPLTNGNLSAILESPGVKAAVADYLRRVLDQQHAQTIAPKSIADNVKYVMGRVAEQMGVPVETVLAIRASLRQMALISGLQMEQVGTNEIRRAVGLLTEQFPNGVSQSELANIAQNISEGHGGSLGEGFNQILTPLVLKQQEEAQKASIKPQIAKREEQSKIEHPELARELAKGVLGWELTEADFIESYLDAERPQLERRIENAKHALELHRKKEMKLSPSDLRSYDFWLPRYEAALAGLAAPNSKEYQVKVDEAKLEYISLVKKAIQSGKPVPMQVINQSAEFKSAATARERYEKGWNTSFANKSIAVSSTMKASRGFKVKRQDGKAITEEQVKDISEAVGQLEQLWGPLQELMDATDITISHTNGKHPFLSSFGGLYHLKERTITIGVDHSPALAHELTHWLDAEAGAALGRKTKLFLSTYGSTSNAKIVETTNLGDTDSQEIQRVSVVTRAMRTMNHQYFLRMMNKKEMESRLEKEIGGVETEVKEYKQRLGAYWFRPHEIVARLVEQWVANQITEPALLLCDAAAKYANAPGWWPQDVFNGYAVDIEREIMRRLEILREAVRQVNQDQNAKKSSRLKSNPARATCPGCHVEIKKVPPPGIYHCSGCGSEVRVTA